MDRQRIIFMVLWLIFLTPMGVRGQTLSDRKALAHYQQLLWQDQHGLPQNGVLAIQRTRDGYLWLGTIEGAARFDGVRFVVFDSSNTPEIKSSQILSLAEDRAGNLWLGAVGGGFVGGIIGGVFVGEPFFDGGMAVLGDIDHGDELFF